MTQPVVGIDVAKATLDVFWMSTERGESKQFENSPLGYQHLGAWVKKKGTIPVHICLEATGQYGKGLRAICTCKDILSV